MSEQNASLMTFYSGWNTSQKLLTAMIAQLSPDQLALPADSHHWTIGSVAQHLTGNRVWWFHLWMGEGSPELASIAHWDPNDEVYQPVSETSELVAGMETTWQLIADALECWTVADLPQLFSPPAAMGEEERRHWSAKSRQWIIWHVLEHELMHAGELSLALGSYGLPGFYGGI
jgi:uncharacterized damage-inducible protein DinB